MKMGKAKARARRRFCCSGYMLTLFCGVVSRICVGQNQEMFVKKAAMAISFLYELYWFTFQRIIYSNSYWPKAWLLLKSKEDVLRPGVKFIVFFFFYPLLTLDD